MSVSSLMNRTLPATLSNWAEVQWVKSTDSTNARLMQAGDGPWLVTEWPRLLGADRQTQGRGRAGRPWLNEPKQTLMFSCAFLLERAPRDLNGLAPALGLVTCSKLRALAPQASSRLTMKWPNDIMLDNGKLAGILVESRVRGNRSLVVVGMGLNLTHGREVATVLQRDVSDWKSIAPSGLCESTLVTTVAQTWRETIEHFDPEYLANLIARLDTLDYLRDKPVNILHEDRILMTGTACGFAADARMQIRTPDSLIHNITVGDVSVRPSVK